MTRDEVIAFAEANKHNYGMSAEEIERRQMLVSNVAQDNPELAEMIASGPYRINNGAGSTASPSEAWSRGEMAPPMNPDAPPRAYGPQVGAPQAPTSDILRGAASATPGVQQPSVSGPMTTGSVPQMSPPSYGASQGPLLPSGRMSDASGSVGADINRGPYDAPPQYGSQPQSYAGRTPQLGQAPYGGESEGWGPMGQAGRTPDSTPPWDTYNDPGLQSGGNLNGPGMSQLIREGEWLPLQPPMLGGMSTEPQMSREIYAPQNLPPVANDPYSQEYWDAIFANDPQANQQAWNNNLQRGQPVPFAIPPYQR